MDQGVIDIDSGQYHTCVLYANGDVKCWGANNTSQAGVSSLTDFVLTPTLITGLPPVIEIPVGSNHTCARTDDGDVWCWGIHDRGQLGCGGEVSLPGCGANNRACTPTPQQVLLDQPATQVSAGSVHTCAILEDGDLVCWGANNLCQLGTGGICGEDIESHFEPVLVNGVSDARYVSSGGFHMCRGRNSENGEVLGQQRPIEHRYLGNGTDESANEPMDVSTLSGVSSLSSGVGHACARQPSGNVWCWGVTAWVNWVLAKKKSQRFSAV